MTSCVFNTCCGCIDLRTGCLIIGYFQLVGEIIFIIFGLMGLIAGGAVAAHGEDSDTKDAGVGLIIVSVILLLVICLLLVSTILLLVGVHKNKRRHVKAYLIIAVICLVLGLITTLASFAGHFKISDVISRIISYIISVYFLLVVRSYYYKMDDGKAPTVYNTA